MEDPFENMREQMDRQRDEFFNQHPRDWPSDTNVRSGFFNKPRTSFGGFPGGSATLRPRTNPSQDFNDDDFLMSGHRSLPRTRRENFPGAHGGPQSDGETRSDGSDRSGGSSADGDMGIPIRVIHERPGGQTRTKYGQSDPRMRNTTELPAKASAQSAAGQHKTGSESPRLVRAASEPPKEFKKRLNISAHPTNNTFTIPENSDISGDRFSRPTNLQPHQDRNPIKTSASAPSVPGSSFKDNHQNHQEPVAPARKSPPRMSGSEAQGGSNVRHIPIFIEGRNEPIVHPNLQSQASNPSQGDMPFSKPSDYYPPGVQRVKSKDDTVLQEPTTPMGPPPGPIPMGYTPSLADSNELKPELTVAEPTTPQGPPPGPIPMGYLPRDDLEEQPQDVQQPPVPPQRQRPQQPQPSPSPQPPEPKQASRKSSNEAGSRKSSESESKKDPLVNVIPIKVDFGRPESPRPKQSSRAPSQEPAKTQPGSSQSSRNPAPTKPLDPKIAKLEKIKEDVESLLDKIETFQGKKTDKEYLYLEEMMTRHLLALDGIEPEGNTEIRQMRKESINSVNRCLSMLDRKVSDATTDAADNDQILSDLAEMSKTKSDNNQGST